MDSYIFNGRLTSYICEGCFEPLANVLVVLYRHRPEQDIKKLIDAKIKETYKTLDQAAVDEKSKFILAQTKTDERGKFSFSLNEKNKDYSGEEFEIDIVISSPPSYQAKSEKRPLQITLTSLQPDWKEADGLYVADAWEYTMPAKSWCDLLAYFDTWMICGLIVTCEGKQPLPGAKVSAFDADWLQDDPLGSENSDMDGRFKIYYSTEDFLKTPFSPQINVEMRHGPDLYFKTEYGGDLVLDESQSDGRVPGREDVGHCFCVELCAPGLPPQADEIPHWERVEEFEVDTDFTSEGYTSAGSYVMHDCIDLHGNMPLVNIANGKALKYRFLVAAWDWLGGTADPSSMPSVQPTDSDLLPITSICSSKIGYLYYTDANGVVYSVPVEIGSAQLDGDGCFQPFGHQVTVDMHDGTTQDLTVDENNFVGGYLLMKINSRAFTPEPHDILDNLGRGFAGSPVTDPEPIRRYKLRFQVFDFDVTPDQSSDNKTLEALVIDNSPAKYALNLSELEADLCNPVTNNIHILYTIDHPHLAEYKLTVESNAGVVHDQSDVPPLPSGTFGGDYFFRGGESGSSGFSVVVSADPACAYRVVLHWNTRHYHHNRGRDRHHEILYCK